MTIHSYNTYGTGGQQNYSYNVIQVILMSGALIFRRGPKFLHMTGNLHCLIFDHRPLPILLFECTYVAGLLALCRRPTWHLHSLEGI